jgi:hypothetical protein
MPSSHQNYAPPSALQAGFVVAMRAKLTPAEQPPWHEWIVVSRWGAAGEHLSIARTFVPALPDEMAPIRLQPRQTALALLIDEPSAASLSTFVLAPQLPSRVTVAGNFAPAAGRIRLHGRGTALRLRTARHCTGHAIQPSWRIDAMRVPWIGEFIESMASPAGSDLFARVRPGSGGPPAAGARGGIRTPTPCGGRF